MNFASSNTTAWKEIAEEKQHMARQMARIAMGLFVVTSVLAGTTFSAQSKYSNLCSFVGERHAQDTAEYKETELTETLLTGYCS